jgi:hypothetical protein
MIALRLLHSRAMLAAALMGLAAAGACSINPQPLPPDESSSFPPTGNGDGTEQPGPHVPADATVDGHGGGGTDTGGQDGAAGLLDGANDAGTVPSGDSAADAPGDAPIDAPSDAPDEGG